MNIPKLRFPGFEGAWEETRVGKICTVKTGNRDTQNKIEFGLYPFFVRSDNIERIDTYSFEGEAILTSGDGVGVGKNFHYINGRFDYHQRVYCLHNFVKSVFGKFIYFLFSERFYNHVITLSAKNSVDSVRMAMITDMILCLPSLEEQQKIATFLSSVDNVIQLLTKKKTLLENYKKGIMQKIFSQEIRFKDEYGNDFPDWEEKRLDSIIKKFLVPMRDKPTELNGEIPWCRIEDFDGKYLYNSKSGQGVSATTVKNMNLKIYPIDTLIVSCSANLGICAIIKKELITNQTFIGLVPDHTKINVEFLFYVMNLSANKLNSLSSGTTISYLSREQFERFEISIPSLQEQQKIADFLSGIDRTIEIVNSQIEKTKEYKKGLLQQMFV